MITSGEIEERIIKDIWRLEAMITNHDPDINEDCEDYDFNIALKRDIKIRRRMLDKFKRGELISIAVRQIAGGNIETAIKLSSGLLW